MKDIEEYNLELGKEGMDLMMKYDLNTTEALCYVFFRDFPEYDRYKIIECYPCLKLTKDKINRIVCKLKKLGLYRGLKTDTESVVKILKNKNKFNNGDLTCEWCGTKTFMLNSHHYPIPKSQGGKKVVHICPNCHYEFHYLSGMTYEE